VHSSRVRSRACWLAAAALAVLAGCTSESPGEPAVSPTDSPMPGSGDLRYDPIDSTLCGGMDLENLFLDFELAIHASRAAPEGPPDGGEPAAWFATCQFRFGAEGAPAFSDDSSNETGVIVTREPDDAHRVYREEVGSAERRIADDELIFADSATVDPVDGWWTAGTATEEYWNGHPNPSVRVEYYIYDENLRLRTDLVLHFEGEELEQGAATAIAHDMARALVNEAVGLVPCQPLSGASSATHCDRP
jgi:hypothetical protein